MAIGLAIDKDWLAISNLLKGDLRKDLEIDELITCLVSTPTFCEF